MPLMMGKAVSLKAAVSGISTTDVGRRNNCMLLLIKSGSGIA